MAQEFERNPEETKECWQCWKDREEHIEETRKMREEFMEDFEE